MNCEIMLESFGPSFFAQMSTYTHALGPRWTSLKQDEKKGRQAADNNQPSIARPIYV
jgi:hypothetical protein